MSFVYLRSVSIKFGMFNFTKMYKTSILLIIVECKLCEGTYQMMEAELIKSYKSHNAACNPWKSSPHLLVSSVTLIPLFM